MSVKLSGCGAGLHEVSGGLQESVHIYGSDMKADPFVDVGESGGSAP